MDPFLFQRHVNDQKRSSSVVSPLFHGSKVIRVSEFYPNKKVQMVLLGMFRFYSGSKVSY